MKKSNQTKVMLQQETHSSQLGHLKELLSSQWWKMVVSELDRIMGEIKENLWKPCSDESLRFNSRNLLNERIACLYILKNIPNIKLDDLENIMETNDKKLIPLQEQLEIHNKKLSDDLLKFIRL